MSFKCKFDKSCLYLFSDNDKYDINKLCGFATTWFHHDQSGRIGWRCVNGKNFELLTYSYNNGIREQNETNLLGTVFPDQEFIVKIIDNEDYYEYTFNIIGDDSTLCKAIDKKQKDWFFFNYLLYPYFGGNKTAPHDMTISIQKLK